MEVQHTSSEERGQVYLPAINWALLVAVAILVVGFGSSSALASAYGIAVTGTMIITTVLAYVVARTQWGWSRIKAVLVFGIFLVVDVAYFSANLAKIEDGGWFPLALGGASALVHWLLGEDAESETYLRLAAAELADELRDGVRLYSPAEYLVEVRAPRVALQHAHPLL